MGAGLALLAVIALTAASCERNSPASIPAQATAVGANGDGPDGTEQGEESASCETIEDCASYLSCIDGTCQKPGAVTGRHESDTPVVTFFDQSEDDQREDDQREGDQVASFYVELAETPAEQQKGLMYRREMKADWGMLFIYPDEGTRSFWMENTFISLDMIFLDGKGRILNIIEEVEPLTRARRTSKGFARYVLELNAGRADQAGLEPGQRMQIENVADKHKPSP
jgi:uncharacterized membrane protein (UPF0127 family)